MQLAPAAERLSPDHGTSCQQRTNCVSFAPFCSRDFCCTGPRQCIGQSLARILHDASIARLVAQFSFNLAPRMGGAAGVDRQEINRLTLQPGAGVRPASEMHNFF